MTAIMAPQKKLASLRLDEDVLERIDSVIADLYMGLPVAPSRNAIMEAWILEALEAAENRVGAIAEESSETAHHRILTPSIPRVRKKPATD